MNREIYKPPYTISDPMIELVSEISELTGKVTAAQNLSSSPVFRRENQIHSIHSSLAIEQNTLSLEQVIAILDGKRVLGPPKEIKEVKNAYEAYGMLEQLDPCSIEDLLRAHKILMEDLIGESGRFRTKGVGVYSGGTLIHAGTPAKYVAELMRDLFDWLKTSTLHPLLKSCVFHYEFEFIHPFQDGNVTQRHQQKAA